MSEKKEKVILGIDLGGTGIKIGVLDQAYNILAQTSIPTNAKRPYKEIIADMGNAAVALLVENGYDIKDCLGAGVGSPGTIDSGDGTVLYSNNIRWDNVPLAKELYRYLWVPVFVNNDANCAALGEVRKGAARGCKNAAFLTLGTGVGGGIVIDGKIFEGGHPGGVELGHIRIASEGRRCTCGRYDCLEAYASATALIQDAKEMARKQPGSMLWEMCGQDLDKMNAKIPFDAAWAGDMASRTLIEKYIGYLADGITDIANIFRPDLIVLGGGICAQGEKLTEPLNQYLKKNCFGADVSYVPQVVTARNGNDAGIIGAACLVQTVNQADALFQEGLYKKSQIISEDTKKELMFLEPVCTENIWGGARLKEEFHYQNAGTHTGECWGICAHPNGDGTVKNGTLAGKKLSAVWKEYPHLFGNPKSERFPLMVKIIDAKEDLSVQVHPDDNYARVHENGSYGKTECWYVLDCDEPATLVVGHHAKTKKELEAMIADGRWDELIWEVPVHKGDFIQIDPGTVHAIKGGCLILETQQNSDITYRLYDYGRLSNGKPRELHLQQSMDVITVPSKAPGACIKHAGSLPENQMHQLYECAYYTIFRLDIKGSYTMEQKYPFLLVSVLEGCGQADGIPIKKGDHFILPFQYGALEFTGNVSLAVSATGDKE